ncbi:dTDP-4-dehydrorhamnose reductase [Blastococcus sp. SYSU D00820]
MTADPQRPVAWLVTGARGQLGRELTDILPAAAVTALARDALDLTDEARVRAVVRDWLAGAEAAGARPVCVNAAAYTAVDDAETDEATALVVNGAAPGWIAEEMAGRGRLVHVSTDYVFDGSATTPYPVDAPLAPRSAYGRTKAAGERAVAAAGGEATVVRTAWVYGRHGRNFVKTMAGRAAAGAPVSVVDDQVGSPTWSAELAAGLVAVGERADPAPPVLHLTNAGEVSWYGLAREVYALTGADPALVGPTTTAAFPRPAPRPAYSVLDGTAWLAAGLPAPRPWRAALQQALQQVMARPPVD